MKNQTWNFTKQEILTVLVVALGYFIDAYDLLIFSAVRKVSLMDLGVAETDTLNIGISLLNFQLIGLMIGGVLWGILADKFGRKTILFSSILIYSISNIANSYISSVDMYYWLRFIAGIGLAGELGVGISLITENIAKERRTVSTTVVSFFGMLGAATGGWLGSVFHWQTCFLIGGFAGFLLLLLRLNVEESHMYLGIKDSKVKKGNILLILKNPKSLITYFFCTLAGSSSFLFIGMFIQSTPEFGKIFNISVTAGVALVWYYVGASISEVIAGILSKLLKERKAPIYIFYAISLLAIVIFCVHTPSSPRIYYIHCSLLGFGLGWWSMLITLSAELFGVNTRATAATSIPTFARAWNIPFTSVFKNNIPKLGILNSAFAVGVIVIALAIISATTIKETFENEANFIEE